MARALAPDAVILSGGPASVYDEGAPAPSPEVFELGVQRRHRRHMHALRLQRTLDTSPPAQLALQRIGALLQLRDGALAGAFTHPARASLAWAN